MILDIATEEIGYVEMLATMIARLLETSAVEAQEEAAKNTLIGAVMGGARVEDAIMVSLHACGAKMSVVTYRTLFDLAFDASLFEGLTCRGLAIRQATRALTLRNQPAVFLPCGHQKNFY